MPGFIVHQGAQVMCSHGGQATPTATQPRVTVSGMAVSTMSPPYSVAGCPLAPPPGPPPCVTANWTVVALRVTAMGDPLVLMDSQSVSNNGFPLMIQLTQTRAQAQ
jgi:hypothetical protein